MIIKEQIKQEVYIASNFLKEGKLNACEKMLESIAYYLENSFFSTLNKDYMEFFNKIFVLRTVLSTGNVKESEKMFNEILNLMSK